MPMQTPYLLTDKKSEKLSNIDTSDKLSNIDTSEKLSNIDTSKKLSNIDTSEKLYFCPLKYELLCGFANSSF